MKRTVSVICLAILLGTGGDAGMAQQRKSSDGILKLPEPRYTGEVSVEQALKQRRSVRAFSRQPIKTEELSQLLWAAQGITDSGGLRTAPSAGALYPLEVYAIVADVQGMDAGVYRFIPDNHSLELKIKTDVRQELSRAALNQVFIRQAPVTIVITGIYDRLRTRYRERGIRYTDMEAGHASQNIYLQAETLGIATVAVGAFHDESVSEILRLAPQEKPLYLMPIGRKLQ